MPLRFLPQRLDVLDDGLSVAANVARVAPGITDNDIRSQLARFLFKGARAEQPAGTLSGGERFRAALAAMMLAAPGPAAAAAGRADQQPRPGERAPADERAGRPTRARS